MSKSARAVSLVLSVLLACAALFAIAGSGSAAITCPPGESLAANGLYCQSTTTVKIPGGTATTTKTTNPTTGTTTTTTTLTIHGRVTTLSATVDKNGHVVTASVTFPNGTSITAVPGPGGSTVVTITLAGSATLSSLIFPPGSLVSAILAYLGSVLSMGTRADSVGAHAASASVPVTASLQKIGNHEVIKLTLKKGVHLKVGTYKLTIHLKNHNHTKTIVESFPVV